MPSPARSRTSGGGTSLHEVLGGTSFWVDVLRQIAHRPAHHLRFLLKEFDPFAGLAQLSRLIVLRRPWLPIGVVDSVLAVGDLEPALQTGFRDRRSQRRPDAPSPRPCGLQRSHRRGTPSDRAWAHVEHPFTVRSNLTGQMSTKVGAIPCVSIIAGGPGALSAVDWAAFLVATPIALVIVVDIAIGIWRKYWRRSPGDLPEPPDGR